MVIASLLPRARCLSLLGSSASASIKQVKQIHAQMVTSSLMHRLLNLGKLIESYFAVPEGAGDARLVFQHRNKDPCSEGAFIWNVMLRCSPPEESLMLYAQQILGTKVVTPDNFTYTYALQACARLNALQEGKQVHSRILKTGLASDVALLTTGVRFYAACRDIESARHLFDDMPELSSVTWNAMMTGYCGNGCAREAMALFREMLEEGVSATDRTAVSLLSACSQLGDLRVGSSAHGFVLKVIPSHQDCVFIGTGLIDMYSKCGCLSSACSLFERMSQRNVLSWSAMTAGHAMHGQGRAALEMLDAMQESGVSPNAVTFTSLLAACCHAGLVEEGLQLFDAMKSRYGVAPTVHHYGCIVDLLGRAGKVEEACGVAKSMPFEPDAVVWRALLNACRIHGCLELAEEVSRILLQPDLATPAESKARRKPAPSEDLVALSNIYASAERWNDVSTTRGVMKGMRIQNKAGYTRI